jgi:hypothetical protein
VQRRSFTQVMFTRSSHVPLAEHQGSLSVLRDGARTPAINFLGRQPNDGTDVLQNRTAATCCSVGPANSFFTAIVSSGSDPKSGF